MTKQNRELFYYIISHKLETFILYKLDLPFDLNINFDFHQILIKDLNVDFLKRTNRIITLKTDRRWQKSTNICGRDVVAVSVSRDIDDDVEYTSSIMSLKIIIPIFNDEYNSCLKAFDSGDNRALLLANIMYILRNKINETLAEDFNLDVSIYGAERALIYKLDKTTNSFKPVGGVVSPGYRLEKEKKLTVSLVSAIKNDHVCIWRYYANKCEISFNLHQNLDCVLFGAMAFESYINTIYIGNGLTNNEDNIFQSLKYLKEHNLISSDDFRDIKSSFGKIHTFRNDIVHGKIQSIFQERKKAVITYNCIVSFFNNKIK